MKEEQEEAVRRRLQVAEAILRDILEGWPNDDERFDRGIRNAEAFLRPAG